MEDSKKRIILNIELIKILLYLHLSNHLIIDKNMNKRNIIIVTISIATSIVCIALTFWGNIKNDGTITTDAFIGIIASLIGVCVTIVVGFQIASFLELREVRKQVEQVEKQCFSVPWSEHILKDGLTGRFDTYLVWEKGGIIVGYCALRVLADEGEIQRIAVLPSWRRNGIAKSLMEAMIQVSKEKGAVQMSLEVRENNTGARNLYEKYGFVQEAVRKNYYENPVENACIMWKHEL